MSRPPAGLRHIHPSQRKDTERPESRPRIDLPPATQQPWTPQDWAAHLFPPPPNEPYWSQQLPQEWGASGDDEDGHTQIRPPAGG